MTKKVQFDMKLWEDKERHFGLLNKLELMFDDSRNPLPPDYFYFTEDLPFGSRIRVTIEVVE